MEWHKPYERVLDNSEQPFTRWYCGGQLNTCHNAVDRHVAAGRGDQLAVIHDSPITGSLTTLTFTQLQEAVARLAGGLARLGVTRDDTVLIYMPMVGEAVVAMLAVARLGATHSLVFGGFAAPELATRISHLQPRVVLTASCGVEPSRHVLYKPILDQAIELAAHKPQHCVMLQREGLPQATLTPGRDHEWQELVATSSPHDAVPVPSDHPCYVLYTSGTTGQPKGVQRPSGGHAAVLAWTMRAIYGMNTGEVWWAASDLGWIVGHSYICYAPLLAGNTTIVYEGKPVGTPDPGQFFRVVAQHKVAGMFTAPTALRSILLKDPDHAHSRAHDTSSLRNLFVAGEPLDHDTRLWAEQAFGTPVLDNWWQTETGYAITAHCMGLGMPQRPPRGASGKAFMGFDVRVLREDGSEAGVGELGRLACRLPLPPGVMNTLYRAPDRFKDTYFIKYPGYYDTMDAGVVDSQGYVGVRARDDDVINVAGHRLSTLALEEAMLVHPRVVDAAVVGIPDSLKGEVPLGLFVVDGTAGEDKEEEELTREVVQTVREQVGPVAAFRVAVAVPGLPRTRSGKTARKSIRDMATDKAIKVAPTIENPAVYPTILAALRRRGIALQAPDPEMPS